MATRKLGIDIGSLYLGCVLMDEGCVTWKRHREHHGDWQGLLRELLTAPGAPVWDAFGFTASSRLAVEGALDTTLCVVEGARHLHPACRNVISVGAESYLLVFFDEEGRYVEHAVNPPCAAGTGSFLEQQAERLGLGIGGLAELAAGWSGSTPRIATRCAVFAKTDMIHAQQEGHTTAAICAGLCDGIARGLAASLVKGRTLHPPVAMVGGVARNAKVARSLESVLGHPVALSDHAEVAGAVGAAILGELREIEPLLRSATAGRGEGRTRPPLRRPASPDNVAHHRGVTVGDVEVMLPADAPPVTEPGFAGIDIGSTSTKAVLLSPTGELVVGLYTATRGDPMDAVRRLGAAAASVLPGMPPLVRGACTTGSGRKMIRALYLADMDVDEISAHARAATELHPGVDTIIEIGGQDSKFTRLEGGRVTQAVMNYVCAAGTGSFIEEQARRLGIPLEQFADAALGAEAPYTSDRCTVYMERDLNTLLAAGWSRSAVAAAVLHSVRDNYLAKVVGRSALGKTIVFQGATARNAALVAAFEQHLGREVHVSPLCHLAGALGAALLAREQATGNTTAVSGFAWGGDGGAAERELCRLCVNHCELTVIERGGVRTGWGMKCGRDYAERGARRLEASAPEKRYRERFGPRLATGGPDAPRGVMGLPTALYHADHAPLWADFLRRLGYAVHIGASGTGTLASGRVVVNSDFCAPMIVAHGQVREMAEAGIPHLFVPALERERLAPVERAPSFRQKTTDDYYCYYSQYFPSIVGNLTGLELGDRLVTPLLSLEGGDEARNITELYETLARARPDLTRVEVATAWTEALAGHRVDRAAWARPLPPAPTGIRVILLGRPYVLLDPSLHLGIPRRLEELGAEVIWQDEVDTTGYEAGYAGRYLDRMHWSYGRRILSVAEIAARRDDTFVVALSCFRCSPDAFLLTYVKDIMEHYGRPSLALQLDELASDVGYTTRIEAALRSFREARRARPGARHAAAPGERATARNDPLSAGATVLVPHLDTLISEFWAASFRAGGNEAVVLTPDERSLAAGYRYANGGECMPLVSILGAAINVIRDRALDPARTFCYLPTVCTGCNLPQFPILAAHVFEAAGLSDVGVGLINVMAPGDTLPPSTALRMLESQIVGSTLHKLYHRVRPYETRPGATDQVLDRARQAVIEALLHGGDLLGVLSRAVDEFTAVERDESDGRKPRIALLGDLYVKYSSVVNQRLQDVVRDLGGELVLPSITEYAFHFFDADTRAAGGDPRHARLLRRIEARFERIAEPLIGDLGEPEFGELVSMLEEYGIRHYLAGETSINVGRALYMIKNAQVEAIIHANPMFCCPGVVTASIFRKIQARTGVPIVDIFYDGSADPNRVLIPHLHYLDKLRARRPVPPSRGA